MSTADELGRTTLKVYVYLLEAGEPRSVRDIARDLNLPTSTVHYHLKKLEELGIVGRTGEGFAVKKPIPVEGFVILGGKLVPRLIVYAMFFFGATLGQTYVATTTGLTPDRLTSVIISSIATLILLAEGLNLRNKIKPS